MVKIVPFKFLAGGLLNAFLVYGFYLLLLKVLSPVLAFSVSYLAGLLLSWIINSRFVFLSRPAPLRFPSFILAHALIYLGGVSGIWFATDLLSVKASLAPFVAVSFTTPLAYLLMRFVFDNKPSRNSFLPKVGRWWFLPSGKIEKRQRHSRKNFPQSGRPHR